MKIKVRDGNGSALNGDSSGSASSRGEFSSVLGLGGYGFRCIKLGSGQAWILGAQPAPPRMRMGNHHEICVKLS